MTDKKQLFLEQMKEYTKEDCIVAFSGGADSSLLLAAACHQAERTGKQVYAITIHTMLHPIEDIEASRRTAEEIGAKHIILKTDELSHAGIETNPTDRCYLCKKHLFSLLLKKAEELGITVILEGTNEDDLHVYRPGIRALSEMGIKSPLAKAGLSKWEVRALAQEYGISAADRPAAPCLATRFPYGVRLSYEAMHQVEQAEACLKGLGFYNVRVRVHGEIVRIEVDAASLSSILVQKEQVISCLKELGYAYITLDLEGFRSGSMDENLTFEEKNVNYV